MQKNWGHVLEEVVLALLWFGSGYLFFSLFLAGGVKGPGWAT